MHIPTGEKKKPARQSSNVEQCACSSYLGGGGSWTASARPTSPWRPRAAPRAARSRPPGRWPLRRHSDVHTVGLGRGDGVGDRLIILCFVEQWLTRAADRTAKFGVRGGDLKTEISWDVDGGIRFEKEDLAGAI